MAQSNVGYGNRCRWTQCGHERTNRNHRAALMTAPNMILNVRSSATSTSATGRKRLLADVSSRPQAAITALRLSRPKADIRLASVHSLTRS
jgi:hypothetical protein